MVARMPTARPISPTTRVARTPMVFSVVWMISRPTETTRMTECWVGMKVQPNTSWANVAT